MNVTIHKVGDYLQLLLLQSHELQLYNLSDVGNIFFTDCFLYEEQKNKAEQRVFPKRYFVHTLTSIR